MDAGGVLARTSTLAGLSETQLRQLAERQDLDGGQQLYGEDERPTYSYVVVGGGFRVSVGNEWLRDLGRGQPEPDAWQKWKKGDTLLRRFPETLSRAARRGGISPATRAMSSGPARRAIQATRNKGSQRGRRVMRSTSLWSRPNCAS